MASFRSPRERHGDGRRARVLSGLGVDGDGVRVAEQVGDRALVASVGGGVLLDRMTGVVLLTGVPVGLGLADHGQRAAWPGRTRP